MLIIVFRSLFFHHIISMQGIIDINESPNDSTVLDIFRSFPNFWSHDAHLSLNSLYTYYGPIASVVVFSGALSAGGLISSCLNCSPIRIVLIAIYVFVLTIVLLYKKIRQYCPAEKPIEDLSILAIWPTLLFVITYLIPVCLTLIVPGIGLLSLIPLLGDLVSAIFACSIYAIALPYSQYLILQRTCQKVKISNVWTFTT